MDEITNKEELLKMIHEKGGFVLEYAGTELKSDRDVVREAVKQDGWNFQYASAELRADREFVLELVKETANLFDNAFHYASDELKSDKEFVMEVLKYTRINILYIKGELRGDKDIMRKLYQQKEEFDINPLVDMSDELKADKEFMLEFIRQDPTNLRIAGREIRDDRDIVMIAIRIDATSIQYASERLRNDRELAMEAIKGDPAAILYLGEQAKSDKEIVSFALKVSRERTRDIVQNTPLYARERVMYDMSNFERELTDRLKQIEDREKKVEQRESYADRFLKEFFSEYDRLQAEEKPKTAEEDTEIRAKALERVKQKAISLGLKREERDELLREETMGDKTRDRETDNEEQR